MTTTDVSPGKDLGTFELTITDEMVQHYIKGLDEPNPWYTTASPFGGPVAPVIVYQQADSEFKRVVPRQPLRQPVAASGMGDLCADARGANAALQRARRGSLPESRDRKSTRLNSSHLKLSRMPSSA